MIKQLVYIPLAVLALSVSLNGAIMSPEQRTQNLDTIESILSNKVRPIEISMLEAAPSPFVPNLGKDIRTEEEIKKQTLTDDQLLEALSQKINPTGIFMFGGEFYLIFKEKKMKVGSEIGILYGDDEYAVTISEITGSTYVVTYGEAQMQLKLK